MKLFLIYSFCSIIFSFPEVQGRCDYDAFMNDMKLKRIRYAEEDEGKCLMLLSQNYGNLYF